MQRFNPGGSSAVDWFNPLLRNNDFRFYRHHLITKLEEHSAPQATSQDSGYSPCILYTKPCPAKEHPRVDPKKAARERFELIAGPDLARMMPLKPNASHIAMLRAGTARPEGLPPACPDEWSKAGKRKRAQEATPNHWVVSHLCHVKCCVNAEHLVWEPDWYNRARDNCPGVVNCENCHTISRASCPHLPPCGRPHRQAVMDWRKLPRISDPDPDEQPSPNKQRVVRLSESESDDVTEIDEEQL